MSEQKRQFTPNYLPAAVEAVQAWLAVCDNTQARIPKKDIALLCEALSERGLTQDCAKTSADQNAAPQMPGSASTGATARLPASNSEAREVTTSAVAARDGQFDKWDLDRARRKWLDDRARKSDLSFPSEPERNAFDDGFFAGQDSVPSARGDRLKRAEELLTWWINTHGEDEGVSPVAPVEAATHDFLSEPNIERANATHNDEPPCSERG